MKQAVKIDRNIETDLAYALKAKECPQLLFLRGNRILYREKGDAVFLFLKYIYEQSKAMDHHTMLNLMQTFERRMNWFR